MATKLRFEPDFVATVKRARQRAADGGDLPPGDGPAPPHFHAIYGEHQVQVVISTLDVLGGRLPARAMRLVREWARLHESELAVMWDRAIALEPLGKIDPLP